MQHLLPLLRFLSDIMAIMVVEFSREGYKIRKVFRLKSTACSQMKLLNFENWSSGELSKIGPHFRKKSYSSMKNKIRKIRIIFGVGN